MDKTITLNQLYGIFGKLKVLKYNDIPYKEGGMKVGKEEVFNALQKELFAQSKISLN